MIRAIFTMARNGRHRWIRATPNAMMTKPAPLADPPRASNDDAHPSASARFRLKMNAFGDLVPEIVPVDDGKASPGRPDGSPR